MGAFKITRGRPTAGGGAPTFDATMTVRGTERKFVDLSTMLASVPTGNFVAITPHTLSGLSSMTLNVWQMPDQAVGAGYLCAKRELAKNLTITTSGMADGTGLAWLTCVYNSGAGETGSSVTYVLGINVSSAVTTYAYGAKTLPRHGGAPLSRFGNGAATAITSQVDHTGTTVSAFEVFKGRLVWKSSDGTSTTYGVTPTVAPATRLTQSPYTVTLNNGTAVTVTAVAGQWDIAPSDSSMTDGGGASGVDPFLNTLNRQQFARADSVILEDGDYTAVAPRLGPSSSFIVIDKQLSGATTGNMPVPPTGWNVMDLEQAGWMTIKSRSPWGALLGSYQIGTAQPDLTGSTVSLDAGSTYYRFTNLRLNDQITMLSALNTRYGWIQVDSCYADYSASVDRTLNQTPGLFGGGSSTSAGGRHHIYIHDNWVKWPTIAIDLMAEDSEIVGNRIDYASEDAIRNGVWDTGTTVKSKVWWNFMPGKWWGLSSHPDYMQLFQQEQYQPQMTALYPVSSDNIPANFVSTIPWGSMVGNCGCPDSQNNWVDNTINIGGAPPPAEFQLDDGEGFLGGVQPGRFYTYLFAGQVIVANMTNGYYVQNQSSASRIDRNTMVGDYYYLTIPNRVADPTGGSPAYKQNDPTTSNTGTLKNSLFCGGYQAVSGNGGPSTLPTMTNCNTVTYGDGATASAVLADPLHNWSNINRLQDLLDACATIGAEASRGALYDKSKMDHRNRTFDTTMFA